jgi:dihydrofolate synthase/folylpolyglutamate synthase
VSTLDYPQTLRYLAELSPLGIQPGLARIAEVLRRLGHPEQRTAAIHIAGTNGKGSTSAYAASIAQVSARRASVQHARPFRVGLYTSPHLHRLTERIQFSQHDTLTECPPQRLADAVATVRSACAESPAVELTFFEVLTAAAFWLFAQEQVDLAIIETGLGGRLDATRLCAAQACVVTSIGLDHMDWLGPTVTHIAAEKAGIFRANIPALCVCLSDPARQVLVDAAKHTQSPLWLHPHQGQPDVEPLPLLAASLWPILPLPGEHQRLNAALAVAALTHVHGPLQPFLRDPDVVSEGLRSTRWPGRIETISPTSARYRRFADRQIVVDAAHNPEGVTSLTSWLRTQPKRPLSVLCGVVIGKLTDGMEGPIQHAERVFACRPPTPRGLSAMELVSQQGFERASPIDDWQQALQIALEQTPPGGCLLVYGSIFLVAAVRAALLDEPTDELLVQDPGKVTTPPVAPPHLAPAAPR